jgi:hypothetical protein
MSGVEVFGIAASVLQIADLGAKVSVKLFGFARKVRGAAEKIDFISKEIAATGALLQQLSEQLDKDSQVQLLRRELVDSADELVQECKKIFKNIDKAIDGKPGNKVILSLKQKIHYTYLESEIDALRMNLENLKSSIGIMQNVLIYAEQLRNRERFPVLKEQQDLLKALGEEKVANEQRYNTLMKAIKDRPGDRLTTSLSPGPAPAQFLNAHVALGTRSEQLGADDLQINAQSPSPTSSTVKFALDDRELREHISLMAHMLEEVHSKRYDMEKTMRRRVHDGVLDIHWQEWAPLRQYYEDDALLNKFKQLPELIPFWAKKIKEEVATIDKIKIANSPAFRYDYETRKGTSARDEAETLKWQEEEYARMRKLEMKMEMKEKKEKSDLESKPEQELRDIRRMQEPKGSGASRRPTLTLRNEDHEHIDVSRISRRRPTYSKVERRYLSEDTLDLYRIHWEMDPVRTNLSPTKLKLLITSTNPLRAE